MFLDPVMCGTTEIPEQLASIIAFIYNAIRIAVPLLLIIIGMVDMAKAVTAGKEDEIKKAQGLLVKRAVAAVIVFLLLSIVKLLMSVVGAGEANNPGIWTCINGLLGTSSTSIVELNFR